MTLQNLIDEAKRLPLAEQVELWGVLGDMIGPPVGDDIYLTPAQAADLDVRIDEYRSGKAELIPGDEAFAQLRRRAESS